ncbi:hypothetical protein GIB67_011563 [Kingdonia uniflora]|uniref:Uncharacterized protein n=1 Tax=Kingdonia uniflora TaxID=39325 RepID=A0A7J7NML2_9MAGN|nr:hypothetical protein GIB67_011563 [Kingdonia uniflora]
MWSSSLRFVQSRDFVFEASSSCILGKLIYGLNALRSSLRVFDWDRRLRCVGKCKDGIRAVEVFDLARLVEEPRGKGLKDFIGGFYKIEEGIDPDFTVLVEGELGDKKLAGFDTVVVGSNTVVVERRVPPFCLVSWLSDMFSFDQVRS